MFIMTEKKEIINLKQYKKVIITQEQSGRKSPMHVHQLKAIGEHNQGEVIVEFDDLENAEKAQDNLFTLMKNNDIAWDAIEIKDRINNPEKYENAVTDMYS